MFLLCLSTDMEQTSLLPELTERSQDPLFFSEKDALIRELTEKLKSVGLNP